MIRIADPYRPGGHRFENNPATPLTTEWNNQVQDEICNAIEYSSPLTSNLNQLEDVIGKVSAESRFSYFAEVSDYSGKPIAVPNLILDKTRSTSFFCCVDVQPKGSLDFSAINFEEVFKQFPICMDGFPLRLSPDNIKQVSEILGSNKLIQAEYPRNGRIEEVNYSPLILEPPITPELIRLFYLRELLANAPDLKEITFNNLCNDLPSTLNASRYIDFSRLYALRIDSLGELEKARLYARLVCGMLPMSPIYFAADSSGQVYYFYNRMLYGESLHVSLGVFSTSHS